eukprot:4564962-Ditylum_brightwellii.AAC.1
MSEILKHLCDIQGVPAIKQAGKLEKNQQQVKSQREQMETKQHPAKKKKEVKKGAPYLPNRGKEINFSMKKGNTEGD